MVQMTPGEIGRRITDLEREYAESAAQLAHRHGILVEKLGHITVSQAAQGERLGAVERASQNTSEALKEYINEQRADKRGIRNVIVGAVVGVLLEGVILVYILASRAGVG